MSPVALAHRVLAVPLQRGKQPVGVRPSTGDTLGLAQFCLRRPSLETAAVLRLLRLLVVLL